MCTQQTWVSNTTLIHFSSTTGSSTRALIASLASSNKPQPLQQGYQVHGFIVPLKPSLPPLDGVYFHHSLLMGSTTNLVVEDANTFFKDSLALTESDAKMANASCQHWHVDEYPCPIIEHSVSADDVDFIIDARDSTTHNSSGMLQSRHNADSGSTVPSKGPPRSSSHLSHDAEEDCMDIYHGALHQRASGMQHLCMDLTYSAGS